MSKVVAPGKRAYHDYSKLGNHVTEKGISRLISRTNTLQVASQKVEFSREGIKVGSLF